MMLLLHVEPEVHAFRLDSVRANCSRLLKSGIAGSAQVYSHVGKRAHRKRPCKLRFACATQRFRRVWHRRVLLCNPASHARRVSGGGCALQRCQRLARDCAIHAGHGVWQYLLANAR